VNTFGDLCEFQFVDGPYPVKPEVEKPIKFFVDKGITPPFRSWMTAKHQAFKTLPDGDRVLTITKTIPNFEGVMETIFYLTEYMNRQDEPFDGFAGFSQGIYTVMMMYKV
jgi:hypothetical protein